MSVQTLRAGPVPRTNEDIPIGFTAFFAPNSLALAGRVMDVVSLHTCFTHETTERWVRAVRTAAEQAGRDPASVRIWSCYAVVHDGLSHELQLKKTVSRLASCLQGYGDLMVKTNQWDPADLERFRADEVVANFAGAIDQVADTTTLEHIEKLIPAVWLEPAATGSPENCAERVLRQIDLGVDGVIMRGAAPALLAPVVEAYRNVRPAGRFERPGKPRPSSGQG